jgi:hypothetical protein
LFLGNPQHLDTVAGFTTWRVLAVIVNELRSQSLPTMSAPSRSTRKDRATTPYAAVAVRRGRTPRTTNPAPSTKMPGTVCAHLGESGGDSLTHQIVVRNRCQILRRSVAALPSVAGATRCIHRRSRHCDGPRSVTPSVRGDGNWPGDLALITARLRERLRGSEHFVGIVHADVYAMVHAVACRAAYAACAADSSRGRTKRYPRPRSVSMYSGPPGRRSLARSWLTNTLRYSGLASYWLPQTRSSNA